MRIMHALCTKYEFTVVDSKSIDILETFRLQMSRCVVEVLMNRYQNYAMLYDVDLI